MTRHYFADFDLNNQAINNATGVGGGGGDGNLEILNSATIEATVNQSIPDNATTAIIFDVETLDEAGWVDLGANNTRITVTEDGVYQFDSLVRLETRADYEFYQIQLYVNGVGTNLRYRESPNNVNTAPFLNLYATVGLNAGDYVELFIFQRNTPNAAVDINNVSSNTVFNFHQLGTTAGGGSGGSGGTNEGAALSRTTDFSIPVSTSTAVEWEVEDKDDNGYVDLGANNTRITIPEDGTYIVHAQLQLTTTSSANQIRSARIQINGSTLIGRQDYAAIANGAASTTVQVSCIGAFSANDYLEAVTFLNEPGKFVLAAGSYFTIEKIPAGGGSGSGSSGNFSLSVGLVAWWKLDEVSGIRNDSSGNGNYLTDNNTVGSQAGLLGNEAVFVRANNEYLERPVDTFLPFQSDQVFSFSAWVTLDQTTDNQSIAGLFRTSGGSERKWLLQFDNTNGMRILLSADGSTVGDSVNILASPVIGTRYHIVVVVDSLNQTLRCYADGSEVINQATTVSSLFIPTSSTTFTLGSRSGSTDDLDGKLDECAYWSRAITADEVSKLYNSGAGITLDDLIN